MPSEWAMGFSRNLLDKWGSGCTSEGVCALYAEALDAAHKQGRIEGLAVAAGIAETQRAMRIVSRSAEPDYDRIRELTDRAIGAAEVGSLVRARIEELQK